LSSEEGSVLVTPHFEQAVHRADLMPMKFSIVTPSLNQGRFIRDCIESVRTQAGVECEHLIVDAGSTDETIAVLKEFPHLQWTSEPDRGMSDGINKGFLKSTGDWVMWLNADDYLLPGTLSRVADFAARNPDAVIVYGDCQFVDESKKLIRRKREHPFDYGILLFYGCYIPSTSTFIRRSVIQAGHLLDVNCRVCMDFEYYLRLHHAGCRFAYLPAALACFRWHETNTSSVQVQRRREERLQIQRRFLEQSRRGWLGSPTLLALLFRAYQLKRAVWRTFSRSAT
jgi:GT2 family glycosyltransferase